MSNINENDKDSRKFRDSKKQMGLETCCAEGLGDDALGAIMERAAGATKRKRGKNAIPGRSRGGQKGNKNAVSGNTKRPGVYASLDSFQYRFDHYSKALGKATALEEVALTRAMMMNLLDGKDPLGCGKLDDPEVLNAYAREMLMLSLKAQEMYMKQEAKRLEQEERSGAKAGVNIVMSAEMKSAMDEMAAAQAAAAAVNAEDTAVEDVVPDA